MSKKNKNKRKQSARRDYHYQSAAPQVAKPAQTVSSAPGESLLTPVEGAHTKPAIFAGSEDHIRRDIIRIVTILGILVILLITSVIINKKTTLIQRAGSRFSSFLRL